MSAESYWKLIERTGEGCYYLWGPIQNALLLELANNNTEIIYNLCIRGPLVNNRRMPVARQDMLLRVLMIAGQENPQYRDFVSELLWKVIRTRPSRESSVTNYNVVEAKKVVAKAAGQLQMESVLVELLQDKSEDVRQTAVWSTIYLWRKEKSAGFSILKELGDPQKISQWIVPSLRRLQSCFELSLSILFEDYVNPKTTEALQTIWADLVQKLFWYQKVNGHGTALTSGRVAKISRTAILTLALRIAVRLGMNLARNLEEDRKALLDIRELEEFFHSSATIKDPFQTLVPYINPNAGNLTNPEAMDALKKMVANRDILSAHLLLTILPVHLKVYPEQTLDIVEELFEEAMAFEELEQGKPGLPAMATLINVLSSPSVRKRGDTREINTTVLELQEKLIVQYQKRHYSICQGRTGLRFIYSGLSSYTQFPKRKYGQVNKMVLDIFIEGAQNKIDGSYDIRKIYNYIANVAVPGHPEYRHIGAILESLEPVFKLAIDDQVSSEELNKAQSRFKEYGLDKADEFVQKEKDMGRKVKEMVVFQEYLVDSLARIQVYDSEKVDDFMDEARLPSQFQERVRNKSSEEELASSLTTGGVMFVRDMIVFRPESQLSKMLIRWFEEALDCRNLADWLRSAAVLILNALCQDELFKLS